MVGSSSHWSVLPFLLWIVLMKLIEVIVHKLFQATFVLIFFAIAWLSNVLLVKCIFALWALLLVNSILKGKK
jgi:hypothetical protein